MDTLRNDPLKLLAIAWGIASAVAVVAAVLAALDGNYLAVVAFVTTAVVTMAGSLGTVQWRTWRDMATIVCDDCRHPLPWHAIDTSGPDPYEGPMICVGTVGGAPCGCERRWRWVHRHDAA